MVEFYSNNQLPISIKSKTSDFITDNFTNSITNEDNNNANPSPRRFIFYSIEDFKTYYLTSSTDISQYRSLPQSGEFPIYKMSQGSFVDLYSLFPSLDKDEFLISHVEIVSENQYNYYGYAKDDPKNDIIINIKLDDKYKNMSQFEKLADYNLGNDDKYNESYPNYLKQGKTVTGSSIFVFDNDANTTCWGIKSGSPNYYITWIDNIRLTIGLRSGKYDDYKNNDVYQPIIALFIDEDLYKACENNIIEIIQGRNK